MHCLGTYTAPSSSLLTFLATRQISPHMHCNEATNGQAMPAENILKTRMQAGYALNQLARLTPRLWAALCRALPHGAQQGGWISRLLPHRHVRHMPNILLALSGSSSSASRLKPCAAGAERRTVQPCLYSTGTALLTCQPQLDKGTHRWRCAHVSIVHGRRLQRSRAIIAAALH